MTSITVRLRALRGPLLSAALVAWAGALEAQTTAQSPAPQSKADPKAKLSKAEAQAQFKGAQELLQSGSEDRFREGLNTLVSIGGEPSAAAVIARLRRGLPPQLIELTVDALVKLKRASAGPALLELTQHRRAQLRVQALNALGALDIRSAQSAVLYSLDDPSDDVRGAAARTLARIGNARALPALLTAAERGVRGAFETYATLAQPGDLKPLFARAQLLELRDVQPALDTLLARGNLPADAKLRAIAWVKEHASIDARTWLLGRVAALPEKAQPAVRAALVAAVDAIDREHPEFKANATAAATAPAPAAVKPSASVTKPRAPHAQQLASAPEPAP